jgi:hypothetical protein
LNENLFSLDCELGLVRPEVLVDSVAHSRRLDARATSSLHQEDAASFRAAAGGSPQSPRDAEKTKGHVVRVGDDLPIEEDSGLGKDRANNPPARPVDSPMISVLGGSDTIGAYTMRVILPQT